MTSEKGLGLDANILYRGVFGHRVRFLLDDYRNSVRFFTPEVCFQELERNIPIAAPRRGYSLEKAMSRLEKIKKVVEAVYSFEYEEFQEQALPRIEVRDRTDWPLIAVAMFKDVPIWTEDTDFFGCGIATWTSDRVELYMKPQ